MKYLFEIVSLKPHDTEALVPYDAFTYKVRLTLESVDSDLLALFPGLDDYNDARLTTVQQVEVGLVKYVMVSSIALCLSTESSWYWDALGQEVYIHYEHDINPFSKFLEIGTVLGFTDGGVEYFNDIPYRPIVVSFPDVYEQVDALLSPTMAFSDISVTLKNDGKAFDEDPKLCGMTCRVLRGEDAYAYGDFELLIENVVSSYILDITTDELTIKGSDKRRQLETAYPTEEIAILTSYDSGWSTSQQLLPDGFGDVIQVPAYPISDKSGAIRFRWGKSVTSITQVYTEEDGILIAVAHTKFSISGTFLLTNAVCAKNGSDPTKGLKKVYVTGTMRAEENPADIIKVLNEKVLDVTFTSDNYNLTEWDAEKVPLSDVSLYMDEKQELYMWIERLQTWSSRPFRYEHQTLRSLRVFDPERTPFSLSAIECEVESIESSRNDFYSSVEVRYKQNHRLDSWSSYTADTFEIDAYREHRQYATISIDSGLINTTDAQDKADFYHLETYQTRSSFTVIVDASRISPRIWDMVNIDTSELGRAYRGTVLTSVISIEPIIETNQYRLVLREE
jgi:hypothetical protein